MDGSGDTNEREAVSCLLSLSSTPSTPRRVAETATRLSTNDAPFETPVRSFQLVGRKRKNDNLITLVYKSTTGGGPFLSVPFARGETAELFFRRRAEAAKKFFDRADVYCSWNRALVNMRIKDNRWMLFKDTIYQKRYRYKDIQLVMLRFTCGQWKDGSGEWKAGKACRSCENRNWRASCATPTYLYYLLPIKKTTSPSSCDKTLSDFEPVVSEDDDADLDMWSIRMPQVNPR